MRVTVTHGYLPSQFYEIRQLKRKNSYQLYCSKMNENFHDFDIWGLGATVLRIMFGPGALFETDYKNSSSLTEYGKSIKAEYLKLDEYHFFFFNKMVKV